MDIFKIQLNNNYFPACILASSTTSLATKATSRICLPLMKALFDFKVVSSGITQIDWTRTWLNFCKQ